MTIPMKEPTPNWQTDALAGERFDTTFIEHPDDYAGPVRSTVVRRRADKATDKAVLYVHGFSDYFLQYEMAGMFARHGYDFYAVDLRKYGRSLLTGQRMFQVRDMHEYFADIDATVDIIKTDRHAEIVLLGHSTGGLTASLYMAEKPSELIKGLMLNSPFLDWNLPAFERRVGIPLISFIGRFFPDVRVHQRPDTGYAESLSSEHGGEWTYRTDWKPDILPDPDMGWIRAIHRAQKALRRQKIAVPILLMHSAESVRDPSDREKYLSADAILDVRSISSYGRRLGADVTEASFAGGLHDLVLSERPIREAVYATMLTWLADHHL